MTLTILSHVNVSKQVESKLEIQEAPLTCSELNAEALGSSIRGKLVCMSVIITVILNSSKGVGRRAETEIQLRLVLSEANFTTVQPAVCDLQPALSHGCQTHSLGSKSPWIL